MSRLSLDAIPCFSNIKGSLAFTDDENQELEFPNKLSPSPLSIVCSFKKSVTAHKLGTEE
jgi:hypothetical protein